ncbi:hypothetical protein GGU10DRAFT_349916 [Lentinula aff. detonsa]|uniref:Uncharacterized protein n=1 Tax=Lentinula aff. detonsa TaxID=2804958 RepID=A0AA38KQW3_9AGAR|nr:hypothetical protein GGU10DRAFT_349916 [Lentinula aff. detonsa]
MFRVTLIVLLLLKFSYVLALAAPRKDLNSLVAENASQPLNFTSITSSGYCGITACSSFLRPPLTDCNITTCACTDTVSKNLATCLQCGYDNSPGMILSSAEQYLTNFTSACMANGTSVQTETLVANNAGSRAEAEVYIVLCASLVLWMSV